MYAARSNDRSSVVHAVEATAQEADVSRIKKCLCGARCRVLVIPFEPEGATSCQRCRKILQKGQDTK